MLARRFFQEVTSVKAESLFPQLALKKETMKINLKLDGAPDKKVLTTQVLGLRNHGFYNLSCVDLQ